jgi:signal transduction histidine kinase
MKRRTYLHHLWGAFPPRQSIRVRLTLWYLVVFGLLVCTFAAVVYLAVTRQTLTDLQNYLYTQAQQLSGTYDPGDGLVHPPAGAGFEQTDIQAHTGSGEIMLLLAATGQVRQQDSPLTSAGVAQVVASVQSHLADESDSSLTYTLALPLNPALEQKTDVDFLLLLTPIQVQRQHVATLVLGVLRVDERVGQKLLAIFLFAIPTTLLLVALGGYWLATRAMRPVRLITRTAQQIGETNLGQRLQVAGRDELAELAGTFNQMLVRLEAAFERQRQFTADASHELRTPLAIITAETSRALARRRTPEEYERALSTIQAEGEYMARLVSDLLTLARGDAGRTGLGKAPVDLSDVALEVVERLAPLARQRALTLSAGELPELTVLGDARALTQLLTNLIENAIKYTGGVGTQVQVETGCRERAGKRWAWVRVADDGPGIDAEHRAHLFDRFYRADPARSRSLALAGERQPAAGSPGGSGLGLSIAHWIVAAHDGEVRVESEQGHGATFEVWLPLVAALG